MVEPVVVHPVEVQVHASGRPKIVALKTVNNSFLLVTLKEYLGSSGETYYRADSMANSSIVDVCCQHRYYYQKDKARAPSRNA